jgi:hypothetical protein|tara:strand:+ start:20 stop:1018 length:999 start_codon:yes stop_codon:yes gene_type:complete
MRTKAGLLGVIRLDYSYPPALGDIDHPGSFAYEVVYRVVPGLTFEMAQSGVMTAEVETRFIEAIVYLEGRRVDGITSDCGFMMYFQKLARRHTQKPVFMSALCQLPAVTCSFASHEQIAILTANGESFKPLIGLINDECGVDMADQRYIVVGCETVPHFEAVALGERVSVNQVMPGMVAKAKAVMARRPNLRAILLECTELPPYADALRKATGLPVFDAITACDFMMMGVQDNERFGIQDWQAIWDDEQEEYLFGKNLTADEKALLVNTPPEEREDFMRVIGKPFACQARLAPELLSKVLPPIKVPRLVLPSIANISAAAAAMDPSRVCQKM